MAVWSGAVGTHFVHVPSDRDLPPTGGLRIGEWWSMDEHAVGGEAVGLTTRRPAHCMLLKTREREREIS